MIKFILTLEHGTTVNFCCRQNMAYINSSTLIINDSDRHCLEAFDITTIAMKTYAGVCETEGDQLTGHRIEDVRLTYPTSVAFDGSHTLYSSSNGKKSSESRKIIGIDVTSDVVHEVCDTDGMFSRSLVFVPSAKSLLVVLNHAVGKVDISSGEFTVLSGSTTKGKSIGDLRTTGYTNPFSVLQVDASTLLVSDRNNDR